MNRSGKLPIFERLMMFLGMFCFGLLLYRCIFSLSFHYTFFLWNLLIAFVPYIATKHLLKCKTFNVKAFILLFTWLMFFPACIYLFTDMLQMKRTDNFSIVYDAALFSAFAFTGLLPGLISLKNMETFLKRYVSPGFVKGSVLFFIFLSSYGICLVRFLHLKSWNVITDFKLMLNASEYNILDPRDHMHVWLSIFIVMLLVDMAYAALKRMYYFKSK